MLLICAPQAKVAPGSIKLSTPSSVLIIDGEDIKINGPLEVAGALVIRAVPGAKVVVGFLKVRHEVMIVRKKRRSVLRD